MEIASKFTVPGIAFLLTLISGVWLGRSGKPPKTAIFNIRKLIALGAVLATAIRTYHLLNNVEIQAIPITLIILTGLCVMALFITGALMSMEKPLYGILLTVLHVAPFLGSSR